MEAKLRMYLKQVWIRETNASEPLLTRREDVFVVKTRGGVFFWYKSIGEPEYRMGGDRRIEGVNLVWALVWNCGNQSFRCEGKSSSSKSYEVKSPKRSTGADRPVRAMRTGNAVGATGTSQAVVFRIQLETGGDA